MYLETTLIEKCMLVQNLKNMVRYGIPMLLCYNFLNYL